MEEEVQDKKKTTKTFIRSRSLKMKEEDKNEEKVEGPVESRKVKDLETQLHFMMIKLNYIKNIRYSFGLILEYHKNYCVDNDESKTQEMEKQHPSVKQFYEICVEFLEFINELSRFYNIVDDDCFAYKKDYAEKRMYLDYYSKEELNEDKFNFTTFFLPTNFCKKRIDFTTEIKEKNLILQHKFFILLNKFLEVYPLPKSSKEIKDYYQIYDQQILKQNVESLSDSFNGQRKSSIFWCCRKKDKKELDIELCKKVVTPLMSLEISHNQNFNLQVLKKLIFEFARSYLKVEELILWEIEHGVDKSVSTERQLIRDLTKPPSKSIE